MKLTNALLLILLFLVLFSTTTVVYFLSQPQIVTVKGDAADVMQAFTGGFAMEQSAGVDPGQTNQLNRNIMNADLYETGNLPVRKTILFENYVGTTMRLPEYSRINVESSYFDTELYLYRQDGDDYLNLDILFPTKQAEVIEFNNPGHYILRNRFTMREVEFDVYR